MNGGTETTLPTRLLALAALLVAVFLLARTLDNQEWGE